MAGGSLLVSGCLILSLASLASSSMCPALTQSQIKSNCTARWYMGIENGSCSEIENKRMVYNDYLGCFPHLIELNDVQLCCTELPVLYESSPINEKSIRFQSLPFAIRTAICAEYLYYRKDKNETYENSNFFTVAASQNWRDLSYLLKITSYLVLTQYYKTNSQDGSKTIPRQLTLLISNAELIDSAYMDSCDQCNICDNKCNTKPTPVSPLPPNPTQAQIDKHDADVKEHDIMVETYLTRKQEACPSDWINGIPGGRQTRIPQIEKAVHELDIKGTDQSAAQSRNTFIGAVLDSHFLSCQFQDCPCPYMKYNNYCQLSKDEVFTGLEYSMSKSVLPWQYLNSSNAQQSFFDSFYQKRGPTALSYLQNQQKANSSLLKLQPSDYLEFKSYELATDLMNILEINPDNPAQWTAQTNSPFFNLAMRTALLSIQKKLEAQAKTNELTNSLQASIKDQHYVRLIQQMKNNGYQQEAQIVSYSLLPFPCAFVKAELLIYVDEAMDDGANGALIKNYLHKQIQDLTIANDAIRVQLSTFYNTNSSDLSQSLKVISPFKANNTQADIKSAINKINLDVNNHYKSSITNVLLNAWTIYNETRATINGRGGVDVVVVILSDGNIHNATEQRVDRLFSDPYWTMNWVALNYSTIAIGVGKKVYENWNNLFLIGRDLVLQKKSIRKLQREADIDSAVNFVNLAIERTCYNPQWAGISDRQQNLTLYEGDYKFLAYMVSTLDQGIYLIMRLPKDKVEVFASLHSTHPTQFDYAYKARLRNERDKRKEAGTVVEYILNVPIFTYEISELLARARSEAYRNWLRPLYIGFHALNHTGSKQAISVTFKSYLGGEYDVSYWTYFSIAIVFGLLVMACCICGLVFTCQYNQGRGCLCCRKEATFEEVVDREWQLLKEEQKTLRNKDDIILPFIKEESSAKEHDTSKSQVDTSNPLLQVGCDQRQMLLGDQQKKENETVGRDSDIL